MRELIESFIYQEFSDYVNWEEFDSGDISYLADKIMELFQRLRELEPLKENNDSVIKINEKIK